MSPAESKTYALATIDWRPLPSRMPASALAALKAKRLVETRFSKGSPNHLAVAEWRRTPKE